jgi:hypothetical protein
MMHLKGDEVYCTCEVKHADKRTRSVRCQTKPYKSLDPDWDEDFELDPWHVGELLEFGVFDKGVIGSKKEGTVLLRSDQFYPNGFEGELELVGAAGSKLSVAVAVISKDTETPLAAAPTPTQIVGDAHNGVHVQLRSRERILRAAEQTHGVNHPEVAKALHGLADHHAGRGAKLPGAEEGKREALQRALRIQEQHVGSLVSPEDIATTRERLGLPHPAPQPKEALPDHTKTPAAEPIAFASKAKVDAARPLTSTATPGTGNASRWKRVEADVMSLKRTLVMLRDIREKQEEYLRLLEVN